MICLVCRQAELVNGLASAVFERREVKFTVTSIPARVCPGCGDSVLEEQVALELLQGVDEWVRSGLMEDSRDYQQMQGT